MKSTLKPKDSQASEASLESLRASISFNTYIYQTPKAIVVQKKVSPAGGVRDAARQYIAENWPLLKTSAT